MSPATISKRVVVDRVAWVESMLAGIRTLPLDDRQSFMTDKRNVWAAESCLRRGLEALLDLGRHVLAKGFGRGVTEYKEIARSLVQADVLGQEEGDLLLVLAGYRNRIVHFYHEVSEQELYEICSSQLGDVEALLAAILNWVKTHPEYLDETL